MIVGGATMWRPFDLCIVDLNEYEGSTTLSKNGSTTSTLMMTLPTLLVFTTGVLTKTTSWTRTHGN